jgi:hypothetical protein
LQAIGFFHNTKLKGNKIKVSMAKYDYPEEGSGGGGGGGGGGEKTLNHVQTDVFEVRPEGAMTDSRKFALS